MPTVERRADCRYAIQSGVEFRIMLERKAILKGTGRLVNISRGGLLFECADSIPQGSRIEMDVDWPAGTVPIALHVKGKTVRSQGCRTAVKILRSSFRLREEMERSMRPGAGV